MTRHTMVAAVMFHLLVSGCSTTERSAPPAPKTPAEQILVPAEWLMKHRESPSVVILHVGGLRSEYRREHIPGARYLWGQALYPSSPEQTFGMPSEQQFTRILREAGITSGKRIVLYGTGDQATRVARVFVALEYAGVGDTVSILDGGLDAWKAAGLPVTTEEPPVSYAARPALHIRDDVVVSGDWVLAHLRDPGVKIIDARSSRYYQGAPAGQRRAGRIPGAGNVPYSDVMAEDTRTKPPDSLRAMFAAAGAEPGDTVTTYCHIGLQASLVYVAARCAGYPARLYDGSFEEWSDRDEFPVEGADTTIHE